MKTTAIATILLTLTAVFWSMETDAQSGSSMQMKIPFGFFVNGVLMPAGRYWISPVGNGVAIQIQNRETRETTTVTTFSVKGAKHPETGLLVFNRYGDAFFLAELHWAGRDTGRRVPLSNAEREIATTAPATRKTVTVGR